MKIKSPLRFCIFILTILIIIWMCFNFAVALKTGQRFSFFGNFSGDKGVETFVVAGVDADGYRTDLILLCQVKSGSKTVNILQIPRDTKVDNHRNDKKINSAYYSGTDVMLDEIYQVTGIKAEKTVIVSFEAFKELVDSVGGVKVTVPIRMKYSDPVQGLEIDLQAGEQVLDGEHAEMYMRYRKGNDGSGYPDGDVGRMKAQKEFYAAVADKLLSPMSIFKAPQIYGAISKNVETDFSGGEIWGMMFKMLGIRSDDVKIFTIPGEGRYIGGGSYFVPDKAELKRIVDENFNSDNTSSPKREKRSARKKKTDKVKVIVADASGKNMNEAVKKVLEDRGFEVVSCVTWAEKRSASSLIEYTENSASEIKKHFKALPVSESKDNSEADVMFIIGKDFEI